jgi:hypothetical protein
MMPENYKVVLVDKYFEYSTSRGLNGKQHKMLELLSEAVCKFMTQDIVDEINRMTMSFMLGEIDMKEVNRRVEEIKKKMFDKEGSDVEK